MVQGGVDGVEMTHFLHPHDQEGNIAVGLFSRGPANFKYFQQKLVRRMLLSLMYRFHVIKNDPSCMFHIE